MREQEQQQGGGERKGRTTAGLSAWAPGWVGVEEWRKALIMGRARRQGRRRRRRCPLLSSSTRSWACINLAIVILFCCKLIFCFFFSLGFFIVIVHFIDFWFAEIIFLYHF
jgi:hypothetical protein